MIKIKRKYIFRAIALILVVAITTVTIDNADKMKYIINNISGVKTVEENISEQESGMAEYMLSETVSGAAELSDVITSICTQEEADDMASIKANTETIEKQISEIRASLEKEFDKAEEICGETNAEEAAKRLSDFRKLSGEKLTDIENGINDVYKAIEAGDKKQAKDRLLSVIKKLEKISEMEEPEAVIEEVPNQKVQGYDAEKIQEDETLESSLSVLLSKDALTKEKESGNYKALDSPELELTEEMKKMSDSLETPLNIYEYVKNSMDYKQYYGSRYGAKGTYILKAGNDYDQTSLLIAMLRYRGYEARYVIGTVDVDIEKAMNWIGAETPKAAVKMMSMLGVPTGYMTSGGKISSLRIEHVWAEAKIPYDDYRGAGNLKGKGEWIPLDVSFKQYEENEDIDLCEELGIDDEEIEYATYFTNKETEYGATQFQSYYMSEFMEEVQKLAQAYVEENHIDSEQAQKLAGKRVIKEEKLPYLSPSLPYNIVSKMQVTDSVPEEAKAKVTFSLTESLYGSIFLTKPDCSVTMDVSEVFGKSVTVSYEPATNKDKKVIEEYGSIFETPSYLIKVLPVLHVDGEVVAQGNPVLPGTYTQVSVDIYESSMDVQHADNPVVAGGNYAIVMDYGMIGEEEILREKEILSAMKEDIENMDDADVYSDAVMGQVLHAVGKAYLFETGIYDEMAAAAADVSSVDQVGELMTGHSPEVKSLFGAPVAISPAMLFIDVDMNTHGVASRDGNESAIKAYMLESGIMESYMESIIFEQIFEIPSVSTIGLLSEANSRGVGIVTITSENADMLEKLDIDKAAKAQIKQAVKNGKTVVVPEEDIYYYEWKGTGYIILDTETFAAAYMISEGICGGSTSSKLAFSIAGMVNIIVLAFDLVEALAALAAAATPASAVMAILFLLVTIMQIVGMEKTFVDYLAYHDPEDGKKMCMELIGNVICHSVAVAATSLVKEAKVLFRKAMEGIDDGKFLSVPGNRNWDGLVLEGVGYNPEAGTGTVKELYEALTGTYGAKTAEEAVERGEEGISYIARYKKSLADAVESATDPNDVYRLIKRFENRSSIVLKAVSEYGDDAIRMIDWYGDDALYRFGKGETLDEIRKALGSETDSIKKSLINKIKDIRSKMPNTNLAKRGNMAVADVDIAGIKKEFVAHSKINSNQDKGANLIGVEFSYLKSQSERIFTTYVEDKFPRFHDTEAKILEDIAAQITDSNIGGTIYLYSELPCCQSCSNIILEFRKMFPNIKLNVFVE